MTASDLKYHIEQSRLNPYFFDRKTMRFFGDRMSNYGVRKVTITARIYNDDGCTYEELQVWELYRKRPVKHGLRASHYFDMETYEEMHEAYPHELEAQA